MRRRLPKVLDQVCEHLPPGDLWVYGYGSLMWNPGFVHDRGMPGLVHGYHRALCVYSTRFRGTPEEPGLVMGLDRGGSCHGMAFRVPGARVTETLLELWHREMRNRTYHPRLLPVRLAEGIVHALAFVVDRSHPNYAGKMPLQEVARRIVRCRGQRGPNADYLFNTIAHPEALGVHDERLAAVARAVGQLGSTR